MVEHSAHERRTCPRFPLDVPSVAFCTLRYEEHFSLITRLLNVSQGGIGVMVPLAYERLWPGLTQEVRDFHINFDGHSILSCRAQIAWVGGQVLHGQGMVFHSGIKYIDLTEGDRQWLRRYVQTMSQSTGRDAP